MKIVQQKHAETTLSFADDNGGNPIHLFTITHEQPSDCLDVRSKREEFAIDREDARQLAAILLHFADTGELDLPAEGGAC